MAQAPRKSLFVFPRWANFALPIIILMGMGGGLYVPTLLGFGLNPYTLNVGYQPEQPVPYSHALHAGQLGIDCRYCHNTVEQASYAAVPPTQTCMNCHTNIAPQSSKLTPVRESWATGKPVEWVKVHDLADYAYFNHSAHVNKGVGCYSCHGRIDQMEVVYQAQPLNMAWCLSCHRQPEKFLRPVDQVTNLGWRPTDDPAVKAAGITDPDAAQLFLGKQLKEIYQIHDEHYMTACSTCHR